MRILGEICADFGAEKGEMRWAMMDACVMHANARLCVCVLGKGHRRAKVCKREKTRGNLAQRCVRKCERRRKSLGNSLLANDPLSVLDCTLHVERTRWEFVDGRRPARTCRRSP